MSKEVWVGKKGFRYWYYKFRDSELYSISLVGLTIIVCIMLLMYWIIPEFNNWFSIRNEVIATRAKIAILQQNINFMTNLDKGILNQQLLVSTQALPSEKDFQAILSAISNASSGSGISLNDYSFQVGNIASSSAQPATGQLASGVTYPGFTSVQMTVNVNGTIDQVRRFMQTLEDSLPLSEVTAINGSGGNIAITIQFYQKPFPTGAFSAETPLTSLSAQQTELLKMLTKWQGEATVQDTSSQTSSGSALPLF